MNSTLSVQEASQALADDHRRLHELIDRLSAATDRKAAGEALDELHAALTRHFTAEEKPGGLYDALGVCVPELRSRLAVLVDDHFRLAGFVRDLRERTSAGGGWAGDEPGADVARLVSALADHEGREHELVEEAASRGR
jgi:hypothetical protein